MKDTTYEITAAETAEDRASTRDVVSASFILFVGPGGGVAGERR